MRIGALILAAGYSSRMVDFKPLLQIGGKAVIRRCTDLFRDSGIDKIVVVTGHRHTEIEGILEDSATPVFNPDYDGGMYSSICCGIESMHDEVDGFFLLPVDIPLVRPATIEILRTQFDGSEVLYPCFNKRRGHPPLIPAHHVNEILRYSGEGGLKKLLQTFNSRNVPVWDRTILMDMDTREDYTTLTGFHATMDVGSREEILVLAQLNLPPTEFAHGKAVAEVAVKLGEALAKAGFHLNTNLLHNAGLLHNIAKGQPDDEQAGATLVKRLGLSGLGNCITMHRGCAAPADGRITEAEIICLADYLIKGTRPVTVRKKFGQELETCKNDVEACQKIEKRYTITLQIQGLVEEQCGQPVDRILGR